MTYLQWLLRRQTGLGDTCPSTSPTSGEQKSGVGSSEAPAALIFRRLCGDQSTAISGWQWASSDGSGRTLTVRPSTLSTAVLPILIGSLVLGPFTAPSADPSDQEINEEGQSDSDRNYDSHRDPDTYVMANTRWLPPFASSACHHADGKYDQRDRHHKHDRGETSPVYCTLFKGHPVIVIGKTADGKWCLRTAHAGRLRWAAMWHLAGKKTVRLTSEI